MNHYAIEKEIRIFFIIAISILIAMLTLVTVINMRDSQSIKERTYNENTAGNTP